MADDDTPDTANESDNGDDSASNPTGCCILYDPNAPGGQTKYDNFTLKMCKDAAVMGIQWKFFPNKSCYQCG
jgi:hypothetical protein